MATTRTTTATMRALVPADGADLLVQHADVPLPSPRADEALVAVEAFSINRGETFLLERPPAGWRPGKDVAGRVLAPAADGSGPRSGERVVGHPPHSGWSERVAVPVERLAILPDAVETVAAAALPLAGLTALRLLCACPPVAGRRLLITGASGGVGHYVVELATAVGAEVVAVSASARRGGRLAELGATVVHDVDDAEGLFDVVLESVGGDVLPRALGRLRRGGALVWFGQASREPVSLSFFSYFEQTGATIRHFHYEDADTPFAQDLAALVRLVARGRLHPEVGVVADWSETAGVLRDLRDRAIRGNAVLRVASTDKETT